MSRCITCIYTLLIVDDLVPRTRFALVLTQRNASEKASKLGIQLGVTADRRGTGAQDMVFSSITFLFYFLPIFLAAYFLTPTIQAKNVVTLLFSLVFYAWGEPRFVIILLISIAFNFCAGLLIDLREGSSRRLALGVAVAGNLLLLGIFKYANFITANLTNLLHPLGARSFATNIALPLGISFFTFHCLSYIIDVYRRRFKANRNPIDIALYISLFPAPPAERAWPAAIV